MTSPPGRVKRPTSAQSACACSPGGVSKRTVSFALHESRNVWTKRRTMISEPAKPMARTSAKSRTAETPCSRKRPRRYSLKGSSLEGRDGVRNARGTFSRMTRRMVLRLWPVSLAISRSERPSLWRRAMSINWSGLSMVPRHRSKRWPRSSHAGGEVGPRLKLLRTTLRFVLRNLSRFPAAGAGQISTTVTGSVLHER